MRAVLPSVTVLILLWALDAVSLPAPALPASQDKPLRRTFHAGDEWRYRVHLIVRSEREGPETVEAGAATPGKTVQHWAEARLGWTISERVIRVGADGVAEIQEQLEAFEAPRITQESGADNSQSARLAASLRQTLTAWAKSRALEFRIAADGKAAGLGADAAPQTDEPPPPLLKLWLAHALRPTATLPERPVRPGASWREPRRVHINGWTEVQAGETDEWLDAESKARAAVRLHVVQEISGRVAESAGNPSMRAGERKDDEAKKSPSEKTERFFAESMSTIALDDGRLLAASRSARTEIVQVVPPVGGMAEPPRSRSILSVQVEIENCVEDKCEADGNR